MNEINKINKINKINNTTNTENLKTIEDKISNILQKSMNDWVDFYLMTEEVKESKLYKPEFRSFTSWINHLAEENNNHVSVLWQRRKAGGVFKRYLDILEKYKNIEKDNNEEKIYEFKNEVRSFDDLKNTKVSPESIELCNKIAGGNEQVFSTLMDKALQGELNRDELRYAKWEIERIKANKINEEEKETEKKKEIDNYILEKYGNDNDNEDNNKETSNKFKTEELTNYICNQNNNFLEDLDDMLTKNNEEEHNEYDKFKNIIVKSLKEFPIGSSLTRHSRRADVAIAENQTLHGHELTENRFNLHGIEIKTSENDLKQDKKMGEYTEAFDYCWLYVTEDLKELALDLKPENWGLIIFLDNKNHDKLKIVELAERKDFPLNIEKSLRNFINKIL